ncbi:trypco2 family protein [Streptomyces sp. NPDC101206]|uniref:trypco2 family protein n=1 Tax=Streptomyces sp. NPDC101206 TaxID=3366128 RepID=UPI003821D9AC
MSVAAERSWDRQPFGGPLPVNDAVELADMIAQLREELSRAMTAGAESDLRFKAERVELELTVGVERTNEPGVKVRFWVFDAGASAKRSATVTQRLTLTLQPVSGELPDQPALISGSELAGED